MKNITTEPAEINPQENVEYSQSFPSLTNRVSENQACLLEAKKIKIKQEIQNKSTEATKNPNLIDFMNQKLDEIAQRDRRINSDSTDTSYIPLNRTSWAHRKSLTQSVNENNTQVRESRKGSLVLDFRENYSHSFNGHIDTEKSGSIGIYSKLRSVDQVFDCFEDDPDSRDSESDSDDFEKGEFGYKLIAPNISKNKDTVIDIADINRLDSSCEDDEKLDKQKNSNSLLEFPRIKSAMNLSDLKRQFHPERLFENFCVVGISRDFAEEAFNSQKAKLQENKPYRFSTKMIYNYNENIEMKDKVQYENLEKFVASHGITMIKSTDQKRNQEIVNKCLMKNGRKFNKKFLFPLRPHSDEILTSKWTSYVEACNLHNKLYVIGLNRRDFIIIEDKKKKQEYFVEVNTGYCFLTYYPYPELFFNILNSVFNLIKISRAEGYNTDNRSLLSLKTHDFASLMPIFENQVKNYLDRLISFPTPSPSTELQFPFFEQKGGELLESFIYPEISKAWLNLGCYSGMKVMNNFGLEDLVWLTSAILLEKSIIFFSEDISKLTNTINTLMMILNPIKYMWTCIGVLPREHLSLTGAPVPIIVGLNRRFSYFTEKELYKLEGMTFVFLDQKIIYSSGTGLKIQVLSILNDKLQNEYFKLGLDVNRKFEYMNSFDKLKALTTKIEKGEDIPKRRKCFLVEGGLNFSNRESADNPSLFEYESFFQKFKNILIEEVVVFMKEYENFDNTVMKDPEFDKLISQKFANKTRDTRNFYNEFKKSLGCMNYPLSVNQIYLKSNNTDRSLRASKKSVVQSK